MNLTEGLQTWIEGAYEFGADGTAAGTAHADDNAAKADREDNGHGGAVSYDAVADPRGGDPRVFDLSGRRLFVLGAGKATIGMAAVLDELLGSRITDGAVVVKRGQGFFKKVQSLFVKREDERAR